MLAFLKHLIPGMAQAAPRLAQAEADGESRPARRRRQRREKARAAAAAAFAGDPDAARRVRLTPDAVHVLEGGRAHALGDTVFDVAADYPGDRLGLDVGDGAEIDVLRIRVLPGVTAVDRCLRLGDGVRIGLIDVVAAEQTDPGDAQADGFVQIRGRDVRIDAMRFANIERCAMIRGASRVWIGSFDCTSYSKGMKLARASDVYVGAFRARRASPHARPEPGHNGLTIEDCERLRLPRVEIEDAAEHAVYLAGGGGEGFSADIGFGRVLTRRSGQCGFKCKAPVSPSRDVAIEQLTVIDAAYGSKPGRNEDGLRVENARGFRVGTLRVGREAGAFSCHTGLYLDGVADFALNGGLVEATAGPMVLIEDRRGGNARILISRLDGRDIGAEGYLIRHAHARILRELVVAGGRLESIAGDALRIEGGAHLASKPNYVRLDSAEAAGAGAPGVVVTDMGAVGPERPRRRP
jgi:hypothetical protein